jgi:hypothetical protein
MRSGLGSTACPAWVVGLLPHLHSQPLCFSQPLLSVSLLFLEVGLLPQPCCQPLLLDPCLFTESSALGVWSLPLPLQSRFSILLPPPQSELDYSSLSSLFMLFSFVGWGGSVCPAAAPGCFWGVVRGLFLGVWCVMLTCLFCRLTQAAFELASGEKWCCFSQCGVA